MDSIPIVCLTGQVPTHLIGNDAFQECDTVGITRPCTKHNYLVKNVADLPRVLHEAFHIAKSGRPGPVVVDIPKDIQFAKGLYSRPKEFQHKGYRPKLKGDLERIKAAIELMRHAKRPLFYTGGGIINSGPEASHFLRELVKLTGFPITSTLMGLGAYPAADPQWLGMLGMHGTYEANLSMHDCDVMICIGARFDDRITGRLDAFSPGSKKIHVDIDPSSINKNVKVDIPIIGDCAHVLEDMVRLWRSGAMHADKKALDAWWKQIETWRSRKSLAYKELERDHQAAIRHSASLRADQGSRHLHHHRGRPASDVGGPVLPLRGAEPLDDLRWPRHHGLRPAGRGRRAACAPEFAGHRYCRRRPPC
jgi:acetolactate synthase-1/2/3 large subunit